MRSSYLVPLLLCCLALTTSRLTAATAGTDVPPLPDPAERAAFQKLELERHLRGIEALKVPVTARSALQDHYDVLYYRLELDLRDVSGEWIYGDLTARIRVTDGPLSSVLFDLHNTMQVDSVFVDDTRVTFLHDVFDLIVQPESAIEVGGTAEIRIFYQGHPSSSGLGAFGWTSHGGTPLIWTLSEPNGAREWWPCKDDPSDKADSLDVLLRGPDWMVSTSNGLLVDEITHADGSHTFHWAHRYPISTYLVCLTATNYVRIEDEYIPADGDPMLIEHFVYPELLDDATEDFSITGAAIDAFANRYGAYPFPLEKYGHSLFPWGGAMEHQTNTSYGSGLIRGDHAYDWILVHELAHQWWGDMTSPADWRDIWLNEGFASHGEALWFEHLGGIDAYRDYMVNAQRVSDPSGPIYDPDNLFDGNTVYNKGAWILHMLRGALGDDIFFETLLEYRRQTEYRSTTTAEFQQIAESVAGQPLDWFFQPWIYGINRPHYEVSYLPVDHEGVPGIAIHLEQTQTEWDFFPMPIDLKIDLQGGGSVRERFWNDSNHLDVEFDLPGAVVGVTVDPNSWILKEVGTANYAMHITTTDLPNGFQGDPFEAFLTGRGGVAPYTWSTLDPLPGGLLLDPIAGRLYGVPAAEGNYEFALRMTDSGNDFDDQVFTWTVEAGSSGVGDPRVMTELDLRLAPVPAHSRIRFTPLYEGDGSVNLSVYDLSGRKLRVLWDGPFTGGSIVWDGRDDQGRDVASGVYLARFRSPDRVVHRRVVWLR